MPSRDDRDPFLAVPRGHAGRRPGRPSRAALPEGNSHADEAEPQPQAQAAPGCSGYHFIVGAVTAFSGSAFAATHPTIPAGEVDLCSEGNYASQVQIENVDTGQSQFTGLVFAGQCQIFPINFPITDFTVFGQNPDGSEFQLGPASDGSGSATDFLGVTTEGSPSDHAFTFKLGG